MTRRAPRPGDRFLTDCTDSTWVMQRAVTVTAERVARLGCSCWRVETQRPGPADGKFAGAMHLLVNRCQFHKANGGADGPEPVRLDDEQASR